MHIYFSGIGGAGIGPLALIAKQAGFSVSGSDKQDSSYLQYLKDHGIQDIHVGQSYEAIASVHEREPIDWFVYSSAVAIENPNAPELAYCREQAIKLSKRDELLNMILGETGQQMIAIAGTHGKTTTTALAVWLCKQVGLATSYLLPAKVSFGEMGSYDPAAQYFIYECDEFDRNFLAYEPRYSLITGISWDHHEIFPTREDYQAAFREFISQSQETYIWQDDAEYVGGELEGTTVLDPSEVHDLTLKGLYNRLDAWLVIQTVHQITGVAVDELIQHCNRFPGLQRRMEQIAPNIYSDYAHTPEKIRGAMSVATEMAAESGQNVAVVYEPLTNRRQVYMRDDYKDCFENASHVYWLPSYLAREDPSQAIMAPAELIAHLSDPSIASVAERDAILLQKIKQHAEDGDMVVAMVGGGGGSLDEWLRQNLA